MWLFELYELFNLIILVLIRLHLVIDHVLEMLAANDVQVSELRWRHEFLCAVNYFDYLLLREHGHAVLEVLLYHMPLYLLLHLDSQVHPQCLQLFL